MNIRERLAQKMNEYAKEQGGRNELSVLLAVGDVLEEILGEEEDLWKLDKADLFAMLEDRGINYTTIRGTGANGNLLKADLVLALEKS
jgi:hypothetical protein